MECACLEGNKNPEFLVGSFHPIILFSFINMVFLPVAVLVFSGKRKSGKDYVTSLLQDRLGKDVCAVLRLSAPLKSQYAKDHKLDFARLLDASEYKEKYRVDMIQWGEDQRKRDPGYFCRLTTQVPEAQKPVWVISDARRKTDIQYFKEHYGDKVLTVRVEAQQDVRENRGWVFTAGVDDVESECGLDEGVPWDIKIDNSGNVDQLQPVLDKMATDIQAKLKGK